MNDISELLLHNHSIMNEKDCFKYYKNTLKLIERHMGADTTDEHQLTEVCKNLFDKQYRGTFPVDRLPKLQRGQCCILNLDTSDKPGSHWVAVYKSKDLRANNSNLHIYDSFGRKSTQILPSLTKLKKLVDADYDSEQTIAENDCGQRSISWLWCVYQLGIKNAMKI